MVAVVSDVVRNSRPTIGYAFDSIGRIEQKGRAGLRPLQRQHHAEQNRQGEITAGSEKLLHWQAVSR